MSESAYLRAWRARTGGAVAWRHGGLGGFAVSVGAIVAWEEANRYAGMHYSSSFVASWNVAIQFLSLVAFAATLARLRRLLDREQELSRTDRLTGTANSRAFRERLADELARARRGGGAFTLAYLDLDHFKAVNDRHGHEAGDRALAVIAETLRAAVRSTDAVSRLGGDEFALLLVEVDAERARPVLERLRQELERAMQAHGWPVTASIGAVSFERLPERIEDVVRRADALMYEVKAGGRNAVSVCHVADPGGGADSLGAAA